MPAKSRKKRRIQLVEHELEVYEAVRGSHADLSPEEIVSHLSKPISILAVEQSLSALQRIGLLVRSKGGAFKVSSATGLVIGRLDVKRQGFGFIIAPEQDFFVPSKQMRGAFNSDIVLAEVGPKRGAQGRRAAEVLQVLKRANPEIIGRFEFQGRTAVVVPSDRRIPHSVEVPKGRRGDAKDGDIVVVHIDEFPEESGVMPRGSITDILGDEWDPRIEIEIILRQHGLSPDFSPEVSKETEALSDAITDEEIARRKDYRNELVVTIDGVDAKDFDDAVTVDRRYAGDGEPPRFKGWRLAVHIADVSHYVRPGTALWEDAEERGTSCYLVDRVIPMLPKRISNWICSLNPLVDRLTLSVEMNIDTDGEVESYEIHPGVIRSSARLTYDSVTDFFAGGDFVGRPAVVIGSSIGPKATRHEMPAPEESPDGGAAATQQDGEADPQLVAQVGQLLTDMHELSEVLEKRRLRRGSLGFETVEPKVILDDAGLAVAIEIRERTPATVVIEQAMVLANETVATMMKKRSFPMVYRIHELPDVEMLGQIYTMVRALGFPGKLPESFDGEVDSSILQAIIDFAHDRPEKLLLNTMLLRSMKQARYSATNIGHFGLGSDCYSHFTSPIRRMPDLVAHHLIKRAIGFDGPPLAKSGDFDEDDGGRATAGERPAKEKGSGKDRHQKAAQMVVTRLPAIAEHASIQEREAEAAERESVEVKICEYMQRHVGDVFDGVISGVAAWGFWVELANTAEGLVHMSTLTDDHYSHEPHNFLLRGSRSARVFRLGQPIRVKLQKVKVGERQMDFILVDEEA